MKAKNYLSFDNLSEVVPAKDYLSKSGCPVINTKAKYHQWLKEYKYGKIANLTDTDYLNVSTMEDAEKANDVAKKDTWFCRNLGIGCGTAKKDTEKKSGDFWGGVGDFLGGIISGQKKAETTTVVVEKENNTLKYTLIAVGSIVAIVILARVLKPKKK